jgi:hypothetical protein
MTGQGFNCNDRVQGVLLALVWCAYTALSILMIIALLTDWPGFLHG